MGVSALSLGVPPRPPRRPALIHAAGDAEGVDDRQMIIRGHRRAGLGPSIGYCSPTHNHHRTDTPRLPRLAALDVASAPRSVTNGCRSGRAGLMGRPTGPQSPHPPPPVTQRQPPPPLPRLRSIATSAPPSVTPGCRRVSASVPPGWSTLAYVSASGGLRQCASSPATSPFHTHTRLRFGVPVRTERRRAPALSSSIYDASAAFLGI